MARGKGQGKRSTMIHPADLTRFRPGGMLRGAVRRLFEDWRVALPEAERGEAVYKDIPDVPTLAKVYRDTKSALGGAIRVPGKDAGPEARKEFHEKLRTHAPDLLELPTDPDKLKEVEGTIWDRLGRPKEAKDYAAPADAALRPEELEALRKDALEEGLTKAQFEKRVVKLQAQRNAATSEVKKGVDTLKAEWGQAYDQKLAQARAVLDKSSAPAELKDAIANGQFTPGVAKWLVSLSASLGVESREIGNQGGPGGVVKMTPVEAEAQIREIMNRKDYQSNPALWTRIAELEAFASPDLVG